MAAVATAKAVPASSKMKKPSLPLVQTNGNSVKPGQPSSSPSLSTKRPPGQQPPTPVSATPTSANNPRPNRRPQRQGTRPSTTDNLPAGGKKTMKEFPEPYVVKSSHILKKYRKSLPSLIVHLHPTHFRFDQQDGSFSYHSEMRIFIEHLQKGTVPHDMVEEFRRSEIAFYEGWLIIKVIDHRTTTNSTTAANGSNDDAKPFSIHNYNPYITPSSYAPYPTKEQTGQKSPRLKQDSKDPGNTPNKDINGDAHSDDTVEAAPKSTKPQPRVFTVALRPTNLSRHMDLVVDAMAPDPKALNRKQSMANVNSRAPGSAAPQTPGSGVPSTPSIEKGPPLKKVKMRIDARELIEYEARIINATAPPLYLDPVESLDEAEALIALLHDPCHNTKPPSPRSRKRTVAELAADDAHAKGLERFMLIMDERTAAGNAGTNAAAIETQAGATLFQPRFEKFNALETIKRDLLERKQRDADRQLQEDESRRAMQEQQAEQARQRAELVRRRELEQRELRTRQEAAHRQALQQQAMQQQQSRNQAMQQAAQASSIPPQMQNRMMAGQPASSPIIRQGTPQHAASSPVVNGMAPNAQNLTAQQAAGSPVRPGSAVQHGHPGVAMARGASNQGPSRHGTPQIPHSTPGMRNSTPVMRQPTPSQQNMSQASPHGSMMAPTPQMAQASMPQQMNGMQVQMTPQQQQAELQRQQQHMMQQQQMRMNQQQMMNGNPQMNRGQLAHLQAQQIAQQQRAALAHAGTPQQIAQSPSQGAYNKAMSDQMKAQMQHLQPNQGQGSPAPGHMTPRQQAANIAHAQQQQILRAQQQQQQQQGQMMGAPQMQQPGQQQRMTMSPQMQQMFNTIQQQYLGRFLQQAAARYNGNASMIPPQEHQQVQGMARKAASQEMQRRMNARAQQQQQQQQQQGGVVAGQQGMMMQQGGGQPMSQAQMQALMQQQQNQQMQMAQLAGAQQQMNGMQGGQQLPGAGGVQGMPQNAAGVSRQGMAHYQQQLQQMQRQATQGQQ